MLDNLQRLKTAADNIRHGVHRSIGSADVEAKNLSVLIGELDDYAQENMQSADNLDKQLNSIDDVVESKVREAYSKLIETSYDITLAMQTNGTKLSNTTNETLNTRTFKSDADILIVPANMPIYAANANTKNMSECFRTSGVQIIYDLPDMADVTNARSMCSDCTSLTDVDTHSWFTSGKVTDITRLFFACANVRYVDMRGWNLSAVTSASQAFMRVTNELHVALPDYTRDTSKNEPTLSGYKELRLPACTDLRSYFCETDVMPEKLFVEIGGTNAECVGAFQREYSTRTNNYTPSTSTMTHFWCDFSNVRNAIYTDGSRASGGVFGGKGITEIVLKNSADVNSVGTAKIKQMDCMFINCRDLVTIEGLDFSGLYLTTNEIKSISSYANTSASQLNTYFSQIVMNMFLRCDSLVNCEITGTIYKSGINLSDCVNLSKASLLSFLDALYDWDTNSENKTTDDTQHMFTVGQALYNKYVYSESADYDEDVEDAIDEATLKGWNIVPSEYEAI